MKFVRRKKLFGKVQKHLCDVKYLAHHNKFVKDCYRTYQDKGDITNQESIKLGLAYKHALELIKHNGRVCLPQHLRDKVVSHKSTYADKFLKTV